MRRIPDETVRTDQEAGHPALAATIEDYRNGLVPLVVPITLFHHYVKLSEVAYLSQQTYLAPQPKELMLRNHVQPIAAKHA